MLIDSYTATQTKCSGDVVYLVLVFVFTFHFGSSWPAGKKWFNKDYLGYLNSFSGLTFNVLIKP